jgi:DNA-binding MarR family transcriptional regulator
MTTATTTVPVLAWERLARAAMHPTQLAVLQILAIDAPHSPSEMAALLDEPLANVSYHVRFLGRRELVRLVRTEPRRGALEHYYELADGVVDGDAP